MAKAQSIWSKADNFLTTTRKIIVNVSKICEKKVEFSRNSF